MVRSAILWCWVCVLALDVVHWVLGGWIGAVGTTGRVNLGSAETSIRVARLRRVHAVGTYNVVVGRRRGRKLLVRVGGKGKTRLARPSLLGLIEVKVQGALLGPERERWCWWERASYVGHDQVLREPSAVLKETADWCCDSDGTFGDA